MILSNITFTSGFIIGDPVLSPQVFFATAGTYTWVCPANVYYVSAVAVGGGGAGSSGWGGHNGYTGGAGGGGGGLGYETNVAVVPGDLYTVVVGAGGIGPFTGSISVDGTNGANSEIYKNTTPGTIIVRGGGGKAAIGNAGGLGGGYIGDGGGNGGRGLNVTSSFYVSGGGGAGGYSGAGGNGSNISTSYSGTGGGGGGGAWGNQDVGGGGGGVGVFGAGTAGVGGDYDFIGGYGGSGGQNGANGYYINGGTEFGGNGGLHGGGGGGAGAGWGASDAGDGAVGAVRIIWGLNRAYPSTNTGNV